MKKDEGSMNTSKKTFLKTWPGGYKENWDVYGAASGKTEEEVVSKCLSGFYSKTKDCLEVGCGVGFWTEKYLAKNFRTVTAIDLLPSVKFDAKNIKYIEVPDQDFSCFGVADSSIDFCWSFGVFCHLSLKACQEYLHSIFRTLRPGGEVALYFSNCERRPGCYTQEITADVVPWVKNDYETTRQMLVNAGFEDTFDLMPDLFDTMIFGMKP